MLIVALVLAVIGLAALVTAVVTSNELIAWVCIGASVIGVLLLIVDAVRDRSRGDAADEVEGDVENGQVVEFDEEYPEDSAAPADEPEYEAETTVVEQADDVVQRRPQSLNRWGPQQFAYFVVTDLVEIREHLTDSLESRRHRRADHVVGFGRELAACRRRPDGHRDHHPSRAVGLHRTNRRQHAGAGGDAVVDQDHGLVGHVDRRTVPAVGHFLAGVVPRSRARSRSAVGRR